MIQNHYFCSGPIRVDPICPPPKSARVEFHGFLMYGFYHHVDNSHFNNYVYTNGFLIPISNALFVPNTFLKCRLHMHSALRIDRWRNNVFNMGAYPEEWFFADTNMIRPDSTSRDFQFFMESGWSPWEGHPYYSTAIVILISGHKQLMAT